MRRPRDFFAFAFAAAALALVASGCAEPPEAGRPVHIVWVVLDAASARHLHMWGAPEQSTPNLDALAGQAVRFESALAQWPSTLSSTSSFLTGRYPNPLVPPQRLSEPGIATRLRSAGWRTAGFSENPYVSKEHGFAREFGEFEQAEPLRNEAGVHDRARRDSARTVERGLAWLDRAPGEPFLLYLHLLPPHAPYDPPAPFAGRFQDPGYDGRFDGSLQPVVEVMLGRAGATRDDLRNLRRAYLENVAYVDHQLGRLIDGLRERELLADTLLIVSSDHGEAFGEHGVVFHGSNLHHEQLHVPLVIRFPDRFGVPAGQVEAVVELTDLVPTILDATGQPALEGGGQSLLRVARGEEAARDSARAWLTLRQKMSASFTQGRFKLIVRANEGERELYDLEADPYEQRNVIDAYPQVAIYYQAALERAARTLRSEAVEIDDGLRDQLEAIGYVE